MILLLLFFFWVRFRFPFFFFFFFFFLEDRKSLSANLVIGVITCRNNNSIIPRHQSHQIRVQRQHARLVVEMYSQVTADLRWVARRRNLDHVRHAINRIKEVSSLIERNPIEEGDFVGRSYKQSEDLPFHQGRKCYEEKTTKSAQRTIFLKKCLTNFCDARCSPIKPELESVTKTQPFKIPTNCIGSLPGPGIRIVAQNSHKQGSEWVCSVECEKLQTFR